MIIRDATLEDIPGLLFLGEEMFKESQFSQYDFDRQKVTDTIYNLIEDPEGIVLVAENDGELLATFAAQFGEHWFGKCRVSYDMAFFVAPSARGSIVGARIVKAYIERATAAGVDEILIGNSTGSNTKSTERFFMLLGFDRIGANFRLGACTKEKKPENNGTGENEYATTLRALHQQAQRLN